MSLTTERVALVPTCCFCGDKFPGRICKTCGGDQRLGPAVLRPSVEVAAEPVVVKFVAPKIDPRHAAHLRRFGGTAPRRRRKHGR